MTRSVVYGPAVTLDAGGNKWTNLASGVAASDAATVGQLAGVVAGVSSLAKSGATPLTGAVTLSAGANVTLTESGNDIAIAAAAAAPTFGTPAVVLGSAAAAGVTDEVIRRDSTIVAFDVTAPSTQAFGDAAAVGVAAVAARRDHKHAMPAAPAAAIGASALVYRYTVTGSDKASIDTGVDTPDAGSNDWTNGDLLKVYLLSRTDQATTFSQALVIVNNDTNAKYDLDRLQGVNTLTTTGPVLAATSWLLDAPGASYAANYFGNLNIEFPFYASTAAYKSGTLTQSQINNVAATNAVEVIGLTFKDTAAITRLKFFNSSTFKFKVGTQLLIIKWLAS